MKVCTYHTAEEVIRRAIKEVGKANIKPTTLEVMNKCLMLCKTKYGSDGMGGIITKGTMYIGYPR